MVLKTRKNAGQLQDGFGAILDDTVRDSDAMSPSKDLHFYSEWLVQMTQLLYIQIMSLGAKPQDKILGWLYPDIPGTVAFPLIERIVEMAKATWEKSSSIPAMS